MNVIGRFFAEEWQDALNNRGTFYTPTPTADMTMDELLSIQATLTSLIDYWSNQVTSNTNSDAIANSQAIVDLETQKLQTVNSIIALKQAGTSETTTDAGTATDADTGTGNNTMIWLLVAGGIGAFYLLRKRKGKQRKKVSGTSDQWLLPVTIGAALLVFFGKQTPQATDTATSTVQTNKVLISG